MMRVDIPKSIFCRHDTKPSRHTKRMTMERKKQTPPETLSSTAVASCWKKAGQALVFLLQLMSPTLVQVSYVATPSVQLMG